MLIDNLQYEERNLGVTACRFRIESGDSIEVIEQAVDSSVAVYQEAIVDAGNISALHTLEKKDFLFMEAMVELTGTKKELKIPRVGQRFISTSDYIEATDKEIDNILDYVEHSGIFSTDKIALNEHFGTEVAGKRYCHWIEDMLKGRGICYAIHYKDELYGFEIVTVEDGIVDFKLGTAFAQKGASLSLITGTASYHYWMNSEIKRIITNVSSNNVNMIKIHELFGLTVSNMHYVLSRNQK